VGSDVGSNGLLEQYRKSSGINAIPSYGGSDYLKYKWSVIDYTSSIKIKMINMMAISDPH